MNRQIRRLRRYLEKPQPQLDHPFDYYSFNAFAWQAAYWSVYAKTQEERDEATRLKGVANAKSHACRQ